ncbi:LamB/YcsF family protein [Cobetia sp. 5-25-4-2]|uniref:LamB/YcsF family protein n=1 Tax=Cobetia sp. 5-25-4-2 TaxID=2737459 RepID=UPI001596E7B7|nr:5-oxoprolinase subunit PxpA [Cobetia sp. 5-25-4-2]
MKTIDLNADMGEGFGRWKMGDDARLMQIITSANIACGFHAGDPAIMTETVAMAHERGVGVGAHPGFNDLAGFGRRRILDIGYDELKAMMLYQIGALSAIARNQGSRITHFKAHGALGNMSATDETLSRALVDAVLAFDPALVFVIPPFTVTETLAVEAGLQVAREVFADRTYADDGYLQPRRLSGAVIHDVNIAARRAVEMVETQSITTLSGKRLETPIDTICVHGDSPESVAMACGVRAALEAAGWSLVNFNGK